MSTQAETRHKETKNKKYVLVRYGKMNKIAYFEHGLPHIPKLTAPIVVKNDRGLEIGHIVGQLTFYKAQSTKLTLDQIKEYYTKSGVDFPGKPAGNVIRFATAEDLSEQKHLQQIAKDEMQFCKKLVKQMNLPMKLIDVDHIFGGERIIFYFMADHRIDFRQLVRKLAHEYQTRIEMRQIGARDEACLLCDYETCGRECCCKSFLKALKPVNMRMAKMQKATLDPTKISGYCGRLKCCLRYEDKTYCHLRNNLPSRGTTVKTESGEGTVIDTQILTQLVMIQLADRKTVAFPVDEIEIVGKSKSKNNPADSQDDEKQDTD